MRVNTETCNKLEKVWRCLLAYSFAKLNKTLAEQNFQAVLSEIAWIRLVRVQPGSESFEPGYLMSNLDMGNLSDTIIPKDEESLIGLI